MKKIFTKEVRIGLSVMAAIVILCIGIEFLKGINVFKPANFYIAEYENVAGLEIAAPVTVDGFKVGQVRDIIFDYENPGKIEVLLALNKNLHIPTDSRAIIGSTLLSGSYVEIDLGQNKEYIELGGHISTAVVPDMMSSISQDLLPSISSVVPKVDSLLTSLNRLASDRALLASIQSLEGVTSHLENASYGLELLMRNQVPGIISNVGSVATNLDSITSDLAILSEELKQLPLTKTLNNVEGITSNLFTFSKQLNESNSTLGMLMHDPELYNRITKLTSDIDSLIIDIQNNPKKYISIKLL